MKQTKPPVRIKRLQISPRKAAFFSIIVLCGCIGILAAGIFFTRQQSIQETSLDNTASAAATESVTQKSYTDNSDASKKTAAPASAARQPTASEQQRSAPSLNGTVPPPAAPTTTGTVLPPAAAVPSPRKIPTNNTAKKALTVPTVPSSGTLPQQPVAPAVPAGSRGTVIIIFDDAGHNLQQLEPYLSIPFPVTISVLPGLPYSVQSAKNARAAGKEVMLHQPMQAKDLSLNPGPGAVTPDMNALEIERIIERNIAEISPVKGVNNHEGSLITESTWAVGSVLDVCSRNGLYFVDSRTSSQSKAVPAAYERGLKIYERDVFIDNSSDKKDMRKEIERGLAIAAKKGIVIMIGHIRPHGLAQLLTEMYPQMVQQGYVFKTISQTAR